MFTNKRAFYSKDIQKYVAKQQQQTVLRNRDIYALGQQVKLLKDHLKDFKQPQMAIIDLRRFDTDF